MRQVQRTVQDYHRMIGDRDDVIDQLNTIIREMEGEKTVLSKTVEELTLKLTGREKVPPKGAAAPVPISAEPVKPAKPGKEDRPAPSAGANGPEGRPATPR